MEGFRPYLGETPARQCPRLRRTFLYDIFSLLATDLLAVAIRCRVNPVNAPGIEWGVVNANCRPIPVAGDRHNRPLWTAILAPRDHPDILDRTSLEHPSEMDFALALMAFAIRAISHDVGVPVADKLPI